MSEEFNTDDDFGVIEPTDAELQAIEDEGPIDTSLEVLKSFGVYELTADWSILNKGPNDEPLFLYCVTNTVTGVREWEDTLYPTAVNYCRDLSAGWDKANEKESVISVPEIMLPKSVQ